MINIIFKRKPILDKNSQFIYFPNNKVCQRSIARNNLKYRSVIFKDNPSLWYDTLYRQDINNLYKFTIVRNPYDRFVSAYFYLLKREDIPQISFKIFTIGVYLNLIKDSHLDPQHTSAFHNNTQFVDFIGRYEQLNNDWHIISDKINTNKNLPHVNRTPHEHYSHYYTPFLYRLVYTIYKKDFTLFGYYR